MSFLSQVILQYPIHNMPLKNTNPIRTPNKNTTGKKQNTPCPSHQRDFIKLNLFEIKGFTKFNWNIFTNLHHTTKFI